MSAPRDDGKGPRKPALGSHVAVEGEEDIHWDLGESLSYGQYLQLDKVLGAQSPLSKHHDEMLFIVMHQASELWMKLCIHELRAAIEQVRRDDLGPAFKMLARVSRVQIQLAQSWDVLSTMTPADYSAFRAALGTRYIYTSLAQEKTGGFWVDGKLFGKQNCHPTEDAHRADYLLVIGSNPWQSHGMAQARTLIQEISNDPKRTLVVVDPLRTETAEKADVFLQVRPGGDAHLMLAMLGAIVQEGLEDKKFLTERCADWDEVRALLQSIPVDDYAREAGLEF